MINIYNGRNARSLSSSLGGQSEAVKWQKLMTIFQMHSTLQISEVEIETGSAGSCNRNLSDNDLTGYVIYLKTTAVILWSIFSFVDIYNVYSYPKVCMGYYHSLQKVTAPVYNNCTLTLETLSLQMPSLMLCVVMVD